MKATARKQVSYDASIFTSVETVDDAIRIIVTPEAGLTSQHRWDVETSRLIDLIGPWICRNCLVLDYGCGIGRIAKPIIKKFGCTVIGVDIAANMRALAASCVDSDRFAAVPPDVLQWFRRDFDFAMAIWTLQHVLYLRDTVHMLSFMLRDGAKFFVVNNVGRALPTTGGWIDDGIDVRTVLKDHFIEIECGRLSNDIAPGAFGESTFWAIYQK
jgi:SAM-dependent methyltransferase